MVLKNYRKPRNAGANLDALKRSWFTQRTWVKTDRHQWRNHARAIAGSARVEFISARAVISPENELGVLCLSITPNEVFCFKIVM